MKKTNHLLINLDGGKQSPIVEQRKLAAGVADTLNAQLNAFGSRHRFALAPLLERLQPRVWRWYALGGGGLCATKRDALNDAALFIQMQLRNKWRSVQITETARAKKTAAPTFEPFTTGPHGAQKVSQMEPGNGPMRNRLFLLEDVTHEKNAFCVAMTGEELDSLCSKWIAVRLGENFCEHIRAALKAN